MNNNFSDIKEILSASWAKRFFYRHTKTGVTFGNPRSYLLNDPNTADITFDISNNKVLANMAVSGALKNLTIFRDTYRANESPTRGWPGVWLHKDFAEFGSFGFEITLDGEKVDFSGCDTCTGFLDNIIPITEIVTARLKVSLICCTPLSTDGKERLRGAIYGAYVENTTTADLPLEIILPKLFQDIERLDGRKNWKNYRGDDFELSILDSSEDRFEVSVVLAPGVHIWVPVAIYAPGDDFVNKVNEKGSVYWIGETLKHYRNMLGRIKIEDDPIYAEFLERNILSSLQAVSMDATGKISGSNWGTNPSHFPIWIKDMFYSLLPAGMFDPDLFKKAILWFAEFGVRHPGHILKGGVSHSLSVSLTALIYSGIYYQNTADQAFFLENPHLKGFFEILVETMLADRLDPSKYLFTTRYLSDGETYADWHTGTNICAFAALNSLALLMKEVYTEPVKARFYADIAEKTRIDIEKTCILQTVFGTHYNEGVFAGVRSAQPFSDGEESDTTLMPFYGFCDQEADRYLNFMRFSMSTENLGYNPMSKCVRWFFRPNQDFDGVPATIPGYMKGLGAITTNQEFNDPDGFLWNLLRIADADGGLWWWPYATRAEFDINDPKRGAPANGKASWGTGVFCVLFIDRFLGVSYNALTKTLKINPTALKSYEWKQLSIGSCQFSIVYQKIGDVEEVEVINHNKNPINVTFKQVEKRIDAYQTGIIKTS